MKTVDGIRLQALNELPARFYKHEGFLDAVPHTERPSAADWDAAIPLLFLVWTVLWLGIGAFVGRLVVEIGAKALSL